MLSSKFSEIPQNIIDRSAVDLRRKITTYIFTTGEEKYPRSMADVVDIVKDHRTQFFRNMSLRYVRDVNPSVNTMLGYMFNMRFLDVLCRLKGKGLTAYTTETGREETIVFQWDELRCKLTITRYDEHNEVIDYATIGLQCGRVSPYTPTLCPPYAHEFAELMYDVQIVRKKRVRAKKK